MSGRFFLGKVFAKKKVGERMCLDPTKFVDEDSDEHADEHAHEDAHHHEGCAGDLLSQKGDDGKAGDVTHDSPSSSSAKETSAGEPAEMGGMPKENPRAVNDGDAAGKKGKASNAAKDKAAKKAASSKASVTKVMELLRLKGVDENDAAVKAGLSKLVEEGKAAANGVLQKTANKLLLFVKTKFIVGTTLTQGMVDMLNKKLLSIGSASENSRRKRRRSASMGSRDSNKSNVELVEASDSELVEVSAYQTRILSCAFLLYLPVTLPFLPHAVMYLSSRMSCFLGAGASPHGDTSRRRAPQITEAKH
jgi:hypothetical protein